ncbi:cyclin-dependent kinase inhibitor 2c-related [Anaeramoeba ignava]|uniref:Cyclin-dependent kinase inhibitor 2c-related n=1 Tax=Anaeramoeba ignava TaxID=1746090 RepID=A0A9Q0LEG7_ANAIG|nr:cyclin-dependent kinase inhibitor 2c-related [Anaeramoeba ignava]
MINNNNNDNNNINNNNNNLIDTLLIASINGNLKKIKRLVSYGKSLSIRDKCTPLLLACKTNNNYDVIKLLIDLGSDVNETNNQTCLHLSILNNPQLNVIELLISSGCRINSQDAVKLNKFKKYFSIKIYLIFVLIFLETLHNACHHQLPKEIIELLLKYGATPKITNDVEILFLQIFIFSDTPLHLACIHKSNNETIRLLIKFGAVVNSWNFNTPLHIAVFNNISTQSIRLLIDSQSEGLTPLHLACLHARYETVLVLLDCGADMNIKDKGKIPLDYAENNLITQKIFQAHQSIVEDFRQLFLRQEFCDLEIKTLNGSVFAHEIIIKCRIGKSQMKKFTTFFETFEKPQVVKFIEFLYTGELKETEKEIITSISERIQLQNFQRKLGKKGLIKDLTKLYFDEASKDFEVIVENVSLKIHKVILLARSDLYRGMFLYVSDPSNKVTDQSGRSIDSIKALFQFLYTDTIKDCSESVIEELKDASDYYQLNINGMIDPYLKVQEFMIKTQCCYPNECLYYLILTNGDLEEAICLRSLCLLQESQQQQQNPYYQYQYPYPFPFCFPNQINKPETEKETETETTEKAKNLKDSFSEKTKQKSKKRKEIPITTELLHKFLFQKPAPRWQYRLDAFKLLDSTLVNGWPDECEAANNIDQKTQEKQSFRVEVSSRIFTYYLDDQRNFKTKQNLKRGLVQFFQSRGFAQSKEVKNKLIFIREIK